MGLLKSFGSMLWNNKAKIALIPVIAIALIPFLFPYGDLRSVVATTLSSQIGNGLAIDFDHVALSFGFPVALEIQNIEVDAPGIPTLAADRLTARPSLTSAFSRTPSGSLEAEGFYKGNLTASLSAGSKAKDSEFPRQEIKAELAGLELSSLTEALRRVGMMNFNVHGTLDSNTTMSIDPEFKDQPSGDLYMQAKSVSIPSASIQLPMPGMAPMQTPSLQLGQIEFKGRASDGKIQIEDFTFGQGKDALSGRVRGELGLSFRKEDQKVRMIPGAFDLKVELNVSKSLMDSLSKSGLGIGLMLVEKFRKDTGDTSKFAFRVSASSFGVNPTYRELTAGQ
jgi:type II secretion system protein N